MNEPICKIYSRKRLNLKLPKTRKNKHYRIIDSKRVKKIIIISLLIAVLFILYFIVYKSVNPVFSELAKDEAKAIATKVTNDETTKVIKNYSYNDFFKIEKDDEGNIQMISANMLNTNKVASDIASNIQNSLKENNEKRIGISLGSLTGIKLIAGAGPKIYVKLMTSGNVETSLKSEFISQGINQTIHRVYLNVCATVDILTPFSTISENVENQVLIMENVIIGKIPENYYDFSGVHNNE